MLQTTEALILELSLKLFSDVEISRKKSFSLVQTFVNFAKQISVVGCGTNIIQEAYNNVASTEHKLFRVLENKKILFLPHERRIGVKSHLEFKKNGLKNIQTEHTTQIFSFKNQLEAFLNKTQAIDDMLAYIEYLEGSTCFENMIQCPNWNSKCVNFNFTPTL